MTCPRQDGQGDEAADSVATLAWRGVVYGIADGLLLSVFPILVVFAALAGTRLDRKFSGNVMIGIVALIASLAMTFAYHSGYSDFPLGQDVEAASR